VNWYIRYRAAKSLIHLGLLVMPESRYKRDLLRTLYALTDHVAVSVALQNSSYEENGKLVPSWESCPIAASWESCPVCTTQCSENECKNGCSIATPHPGKTKGNADNA